MFVIDRASERRQHSYAEGTGASPRARQAAGDGVCAARGDAAWCWGDRSTDGPQVQDDEYGNDALPNP